MVLWEELPEHLKESNRRQADHIGVKLRAAGCAIAPLTNFEEPFFRFTAEEIEVLAGIEHARWVEERRGSGWVPGPKDAENKTTPYLVPWDQLSEEIREIDRETVREMPPILAGAGFRIVRRPTSPPHAG